MRDILIFAIIFGALPFVFKRPWVGIMLWTWLAYMNPHRQAWGAAYDFPFSMVVGLVTIIAFVFSRDKKEMIWTRETVVLAIFIAWMFLTTQFAFYPELAALQWNKVWKIHLMIFLVVMLIKNKEQINWMVWVIALSLGYYGVKGGIFTIMHGGQFRVQGPADTFIGGNNEMALALVMLVPLIRYLHLQATRAWVRLGLSSAMVLTGIAAIGSSLPNFSLSSETMPDTTALAMVMPIAEPIPPRIAARPAPISAQSVPASPQNVSLTATLLLPAGKTRRPARHSWWRI